MSVLDATYSHDGDLLTTLDLLEICTSWCFSRYHASRILHTRSTCIQCANAICEAIWRFRNWMSTIGRSYLSPSFQGFLVREKTTLLNHISLESKRLKVAVIVNDMSEINIDANLSAMARQIFAVRRTMIEMPNGCICCTLREDLLIEVSRLAQEGRFDYLLIEIHRNQRTTACSRDICI